MATVTNVGTAYDAVAASKGLGMFVENLTGITQVRLVVFYNKVGSGTISWQLWNVTDAAELCRIDDAGGSGEKILDQTFNVTGAGEKLFRLRAKSTVAGDDPVLYDYAVYFK